MIDSDFDWGKHFTDSSFKAIQKLSPELAGRRPPSSFSPDGSLFYLSSVDGDCSTSDIDELQATLRGLGETFHSLKATEYQRRYLYHSDFWQVCIMLYNLGETDGDYDSPDILLETKGYTVTQSAQ